LFGDTSAAVSLLTVTVISVDRYLAYRPRGKYRDIVTLKKTLLAIACYWMIACLWIGLWLGSKRAAQQLQTVVVSFCFLSTSACYTRVCVGLRFCKAHIQARNTPNAVTMVFYKKSVFTMRMFAGFFFSVIHLISFWKQFRTFSSMNKHISVLKHAPKQWRISARQLIHLFTAVQSKRYLSYFLQ